MTVRHGLLALALAVAACTGGDEPVSDGLHSQAYGSGVLFGYLLVLMLILTGAAIIYRLVTRTRRRR